MHTLEDSPAPAQLELNDLAVIKLRLAEPLVVDLYSRDRGTGAFILIDEATNDTVAAGMVLAAE
jgi:sulfate adenylyltransferase subunit 1 (EFTu-like GTPase family)